MQEIRNAQGQKYTLQEYLREHSDGLFQICSKVFGGILITGDAEYIKGHLQNHFFGSCVKGVDIDEYGTTIYLI